MVRLLERYILAPMNTDQSNISDYLSMFLSLANNDYKVVGKSQATQAFAVLENHLELPKPEGRPPDSASERYVILSHHTAPLQTTLY